MSDCALCKRPLDDSCVVGTTSRHGHASRRVACLMCGLVQVCPQPSASELDAFYASHAYREEHGPAPLTVTSHGASRVILPGSEEYPEVVDAMARFRHRWAGEWAGLIRGMRLLEIGSGDGRTLAAFAEDGLVCTGVEPDRDEARESATRLPAPTRVHASTYREAELEPPYDAIAAYHVLEHLHDPVAALTDWRRMLTPRGALLLEVPDIFDPGMPIDTGHFQWVHLFDFSQHTLIGCLVRAGYQPVQVKSWSHAIRVLARPAAQAPTYEMPHGGAYVEGYLDALRRWSHRGQHG